MFERHSNETSTAGLVLNFGTDSKAIQNAFHACRLVQISGNRWSGPDAIEFKTNTEYWAAVMVPDRPWYSPPPAFADGDEFYVHEQRLRKTVIGAFGLVFAAYSGCQFTLSVKSRQLMIE